MKQNFIQTIKLISSDFHRYTGENKNILLFFIKYFHNPGMFFSILYRFERYLMFNSNIFFKIIGYLFYPFYFFTTYFILDYHIEPMVEVKDGLFLHNRDIVITDNTKIGKNFSIMGQTTIATDFESKNVSIIIGDNVKIGTGVRIIAKDRLEIASGVIVGANAVVTKSLLKENSVYVGIPAKLVRKK